MALTSLQVCMDSPDWLQGTILEDSGMNSSSSPSSGDMRPLIERRLRPPQDQALKCPRCDSTHTKFCYYNNYSLSQPRYFCKTCRRYWTKGGTLRNIPVGGGCRKNRRVSSKKNHDLSLNNDLNNPPSSLNPADLHLSFPDPVQLSHLNNDNPNFMDIKYDFITENSRPIGFMDTKYDLMGNSAGDMSTTHGFAANFHGSSTLYSPFGMSLEGNYTGNFLDSCQRLAFPYEEHVDHSSTDVKPNTKILSLEWQDQGCSDAGKESFGYLTNGFGSWTGLMNGYGSSATNPLI